MMAREHEEPGRPSTSEQCNAQEEEEQRKEHLPREDSKRKRWWNIWKKWEGQDSDWWFASTGIPLLAATLGPLANVSSIAALVTPWRQSNIINGQKLSDFNGVPFGDPRW